MRQFFSRGHFTAIGDSDYHGPGPMGLCRTLVFARENSVSAILEALRGGRTLVYDREGRAYGDPELIRLSAADPRVLALSRGPRRHGPAALLSAITGILGMLAWLFLDGIPGSRCESPD